MNNVAVMLIFVDNFEEVMESLEEIRRPVMVALIDRRISLLARDTDAVFRKFEKDKFLFVLTDEKATELRDTKFEIRDKVREIEMGSVMPATLSIGIGMGGETMAQTMEYAQAAIDLALGRGGDQAVVKIDSEIMFYGGGSPENPSNERVTARLKLWALDGLMEVSRNIIVMGHRVPDMDSFGAAVGIYKLAARKGYPCRILVGELTGSINSLLAVMMADEEYRDVFTDKEAALKDCDSRTLVVIVDANRPSMVESRRIMAAAGKLAVLDHHRLASDFISNAALTYQDPFASSTCELVCEMMTHLREPIKFKPVEADAMLAGITVDTKFFVQKTGAKTFDAAAFLRRAGADSTRIKQYLQEEEHDVLAMARAVAGVEIVGGRFAVTCCEGAVNPAQTAARAADELMNIAGVHASFVMTALPGGTGTHISARSLGKVNVQLPMEKLGGGGHRTMAAGVVDADITAARDILDDLLADID